MVPRRGSWHIDSSSRLAGDSIDTNPAARLAAELLGTGFRRYRDEFTRLTRAVVGHFETGDWDRIRRDTDARLSLYPDSVNDLVVRLGQLSHWHELPWAAIRRRYQAMMAGEPDEEIAATFYNSTIRRLHGTVGVDSDHEFLDLGAPELPAIEGLSSVTATGEELAEAVNGAFASLGWTRWRDRAACSRRVASRLEQTVGGNGGPVTLEWLPAALVRRERGFLVGRIKGPGAEAGWTPVVVCFEQSGEGLVARAVVTGADGASIVFGFTRSYFHVDVAAPRMVVAFLWSLMPSKRVDELYTVIGYHRHGKREFYQALERALEDSTARFEPIEGVKGLVMLAFVLKPLNVVFKVIRDRAAPPKLVSRKEVMAKYEFVFHHEHGGRLADTQEFTGLALRRSAFAPEVVEELETEARESVTRSGDRLVFKHLYTERRMTPLDVYLREAPGERATEAVLDFGQAIRDLAGLNLFPGDLLPKNFGVTRHGRVVFYDYDEISTLEDCVFRAIPSAARYEDEVAAEPWFSVGPSDVFPEEWERFIRFQGSLHEAFREQHAELFTAEYWRAMRDRVQVSGVVDPPPFGRESLV